MSVPDVSEDEDLLTANPQKRTLTRFDEAMERILADLPPIAGTQEVEVMEGFGRPVAQPVSCAIALPPFDQSAMDGYALGPAAALRNGVFAFRVIATVTAGQNVRDLNLKTGEAARVFTGATMPTGTVAVMRQEEVETGGDGIRVTALPESGRDIRKAGEDLRPGTELLSRGRLMTARDCAALASAGINTVRVFRRLRVGILSNGSELANPGETLQPGQIYNSNRSLLRAELNRPWIELFDFGIIRDDRDLLRDKLSTALGQRDVIITTGSASVGAEDHMLSILGEIGADIRVAGIDMRPGKPVIAARIDGKALMALPGSPSGASVVFTYCVLPLLRRLAGITENVAPPTIAIATFDHEKPEGRRDYVPVSVVGADASGRLRIERAACEDRGKFFGIQRADGFAILDETMGDLKRGMPVRFDPSN